MLSPAPFRKRSNYLVACCTEIFQPFIQLYASTRARRAQSDPKTWRKGLLLGETHIGDVLYNTASLPALRKGLPDCEWHYLAESPAAEVLVTNPHLAGVINYPRPRFNKPFAVSARIEEVESILREQDFDVAICYNSGMYWRDLLLATRLGIPNRVGYVHKGFSGLVTFPISVDYPQPYPAYFRDLVSQVTRLRPTWDLCPKVYPLSSDRRDAEALWQDLKLDAKNPVLACFATTRQPSEVWPLESFGKTLSLLSEQHQFQIVLCGASGDAAVLHSLKEQFKLPCHINAGRLSLRALAAFLERCSAVLSPDSGPRHLGNAARIPVLFIRNLRSDRVETGSYLSTDIDLAPLDVEYVPPEAQAKYLNSIQPEFVAKQVIDTVISR